MRNWLVAVAAGSGALIAILPAASAQEVQRTGGGAASVACAFSVGAGVVSCLGPGTSLRSFSTPDGTASVSNNVAITGMNGGSQVTMSANSIQISGDASFAPPSGCDSGSVGGQGPTYSANGSQSVYADVPNGTPIRITINASASGTGGGGASWSDAKSGVGGASGTTVFDAAAGPGKITVSGVDYYLIDSINAGGTAGARFICTGANSQSFNASLGLSFCVAAGKMKAASSTAVIAVVNTPIKLKVQVNNGCTTAPLSGQSISFSTVSVPTGGANVNLTASAQTDADGFAAVSFTPGSAPGVYSVDAVCAACGADRRVTFTVTAITLKQATSLIKISGDGTGVVLTSLPNPLVARALNTVTNAGQPGFAVTFQSVSPATFLPPTTATTDGLGLASLSVTLGATPGAYTVTAHCPDCQAQQDAFFLVNANGNQPNAAGLFPTQTNASASGVNPAAPPSTTPGSSPGINPAAPTVRFNQAPVAGYGKDVDICATVTPPSIADSIFYSSLQNGFEVLDVTPSPMAGCNFPNRTIRVRSNALSPTCQTTDTVTAGLNGQIIGSVLASAVLPTEKARFVSSGNDCLQFPLWQRLLGALGNLQCPFDLYSINLQSQYDTTFLPITEQVDSGQAINALPTLGACNRTLELGDRIVTDSLGTIRDKLGMPVLTGGVLGFQVTPCAFQTVQHLFVGSCHLQDNILQEILFATGAVETRRSDCDPAQPACKGILR